MPIAFFRALPKVDIHMDDRLYRYGEDLHVRVSARVEKPGLKVRHATVQLFVDHRFRSTRRVPLPRQNPADEFRWPFGGARTTIGDMNGANDISRFNSQPITERRVETEIQDEKVIISNGTLRYRIQSFDTDFTIQSPGFTPRSDSSYSYFVRLRMGLQRMPDIKLHRAVRVKIPAVP